MKVKILAILALFLLNIPLAFAFSDIDGHWAEDYIVEMSDRGIVEGYSDDTFAPEQYVTRAEFLKMALTTLDFEVEDASFKQSTFGDIATSAWYHDYIEAAYDLEVVQGYAGNVFLPDQTVTRAEAVEILWNLRSEKTVLGTLYGYEDFVDIFTDVEEEDWYSGPVWSAYYHEIISGYGDGAFGPHDKLTRAQASKICLETENSI